MTRMMKTAAALIMVALPASGCMPSVGGDVAASAADVVVGDGAVLRSAVVDGVDVMGAGTDSTATSEAAIAAPSTAITTGTTSMTAAVVPETGVESGFELNNTGLWVVDGKIDRVPRPAAPRFCHILEELSVDGGPNHLTPDEEFVMVVELFQAMEDESSEPGTVSEVEGIADALRPLVEAGLQAESNIEVIDLMTPAEMTAATAAVERLERDIDVLLLAPVIECVPHLIPAG